MGGEVSNKLEKILMISARSDTGGGPAHMFELSYALSGQIKIYAALPSDGLFYDQFRELLEAESVFEIPRQRLTIKAVAGLFCFCKQKGITLIHSHGKGAGTYSRLLGILLGIPVIHTLHGYHDEKYPCWVKKVYAGWEKLAGWATQKIVCVSASEAELFRKKVGVPEDKVVIIPNGTRISKCSAEQIVRNKVVTVARFDHQKNLLELVKVAIALPAWDFYLIGDGEDRTEIEAYISKYDVRNLRLCGMSQQVLTDIADATVYLTTSRVEGLPLAVLEAMSLGIPVVASDVVGNRDAVAVGITGYLYPLGDIPACVAAMEQATLLDRVQIRKFHCENFSSDRMIAKTLDVYKSMLKRRVA